MTSLDPSGLLVRATALYLPTLLVVALAVQVRPSRRRIAGALLATCWNVPALLALNLKVQVEGYDLEVELAEARAEIDA